MNIVSKKNCRSLCAPWILFGVYIFLLIFTACSSYHKFSCESDLYVDEETGCKYYCAPIYYEPVVVGPQLGKYKSSGSGIIYEIDGLDSSLWLCDNEDGVKTVFYSVDIELPSFKEFEPDFFSIFLSDADRKFTSSGDSDLIADIVGLLESGENAEVPFDNTAMYYLKFESQKYSGIYYNIMAIHERDLGKIFIYDRGSKKTVDSGSILYGMLPYTDSLKNQSN